MEGDAVYLTSDTHVGHTMRFVMKPSTSQKSLEKLDDGGVLIPKGKTLVRLLCLKCNVLMREDKDYRIVSARKDEGDRDGGDWKERHSKLYPATFLDDETWLTEHRSLYHEAEDGDWLKDHKELYGD